MRHLRVLAGSVLVVVLGLVPLAAPASAATTWHLVGCANTEFSGAKICFYWATGHRGQGRFINNSSHDINNQGTFAVQSGAGVMACGRVVTDAHTTDTCTRTLVANKPYRLTDNYINPRLEQRDIRTAAHTFTS